MGTDNRLANTKTYKPDFLENRWYKELEAKYGQDFCIEAGFFDEDRPFSHSYFIPEFPKGKTVIQFSGAFYPFHEGHMSIVKSAVDAILERTEVQGGVVVLHADHGRYRFSKGQYDEELFRNALGNLEPYRNFDFVVIFEDDMFLSCSRNFTWLYEELSKENDVYFLSGGDRANYALTFIDNGKCIIAGRDNHPNFAKYSHLENDRLWFIKGNNETSSTAIRSQLNKD